MPNVNQIHQRLCKNLHWKIYHKNSKSVTLTLRSGTGRGRNQHSMAFQTPIANTDVQKGSFFPQIIRDWNALPDSLISSAEDAWIVLLSSLLWWELGTNSLITGPGEWFSFRHILILILGWGWYRVNIFTIIYHHAKHESNSSKALQKLTLKKK